MFSTPRNSIFQRTRLTPPTSGLIISSAHCGNICCPLTGRAASFFDENEPLRLTFFNYQLILQRPFLIDELDVNSRDAVGADVLGANGGVERDSVLLACQTNEASPGRDLVS